MRRPSLKRVRIIRGIKTLGNIKKGGFAMAGKNNSKTIINLKGKERKNLKDNLSISEYGLSHVDEVKDLRITSEELQEIDEMSNDIVSTEAVSYTHLYHFSDIIISYFLYLINAFH